MKILLRYSDEQKPPISLLNDCKTDGDKYNIIISPNKISSIFSRIKTDDVILMGFSKDFRPEWLVQKVIPIPPPNIRPSIHNGAQRGEDDLTYKLADIIKYGNSLNDNKGLDPNNDKLRRLQYHYTTLIDNSKPGVQSATHKSGRPIKSLTQRIKGKEGRIRGNLMGKRVDFSARCVISPDPTMGMEYVGVPLKIASNLTVPETYTIYSKERLDKYIENGPNVFPGAKYILSNNTDKVIDLQYSTSRQVSYGDIVYRHLMDDDLVLFNRQPTLHRMSMMAHKVKVMPYFTFRLNLSTTTPYNADFDGDEMNLHVPQSLETKAELSEIMTVSKNIVSSQSNRPVMGITQDALLGSSRLTKDDTFLEKDLMMNCLIYHDNIKVCIYYFICRFHYQQY